MRYCRSSAEVWSAEWFPKGSHGRNCQNIRKKRQGEDMTEVNVDYTLFCLIMNLYLMPKDLSLLCCSNFKTIVRESRKLTY